ncbi:hypothetical protein EJ110_NYTH33093 [Nymphaea thermarum]|nr:hypothetical protein EJ110_NYTH33093 [Nymphaea thermarum]
MLCPSPAFSVLRSWLRDYDRIQSVAVFLIYVQLGTVQVILPHSAVSAFPLAVQIGCSLIGSVGALYNGVLLINLAVSLFALVAIESSSQSLGRTYAVLLVCAIVLDVVWFVLFFREIWNISTDKYGGFVIFSLRVALSMEIVGFSVRLLSSFVWIQMYRLGASCVNTVCHDADFDLRTSFINPTHYPILRQNSDNCDAIGGSIYDPASYSSLFEDVQDGGLARMVGSCALVDVALCTQIPDSFIGYSYFW